MYKISLKGGHQTGISLYTRSSSEGKFVEYSARLGEEFVHETNKQNFAPTLVNYDLFLAMSLPFLYLMLCISLYLFHPPYI